VETYVDIIETAREALRRRNEARRRLEQTLPPETPARSRERPGDSEDEQSWLDDDDGPETWPAMFA
jgi:hypothetical protein